MKRIKKVAGFVLLLPVWFYRLFISPLTGASCRHVPTCSQYAIDAVRNTGPLRGLLLATNRLFRCRPGGTHGFDPAPVIWVKRYSGASSFIKRNPASNRLRHHKE